MKKKFKEEKIKNWKSLALDTRDKELFATPKELKIIQFESVFQSSVFSSIL